MRIDPASNCVRRLEGRLKAGPRRPFSTACYGRRYCYVLVLPPLPKMLRSYRSDVCSSPAINVAQAATARCRFGLLLDAGEPRCAD